MFRMLISPQSLSSACKSFFTKSMNYKSRRDLKDQHFEEARNESIHYGCASIKGYRPTMEDEFNAILEIPNELLSEQSEKNSLFYFAVYDGHGGPNVSRKLSEGLYSQIIYEEIQNMKKYYSNKDGQTEYQPYHWLTDDAQIQKHFMKFDKQYCKNYSVCGSTAVTVFISRNQHDNTWEIICANTGDSSAVLYDRGATVVLNRRHDTSIPEERSRVMNARCQIIDDYVFSPCE